MKKEVNGFTLVICEDNKSIKCPYWRVEKYDFNNNDVKYNGVDLITISPRLDSCIDGIYVMDYSYLFEESDVKLVLEYECLGLNLDKYLYYEPGWLAYLEKLESLGTKVSVDLSCVDLSNAIAVDRMFFKCGWVSSVRFGSVIGKWWGDNADAMIASGCNINFQAMFYRCSSLHSVDFSKSIVCGSVNCFRMFYKCEFLEDVKFWSGGEIVSMISIFSGSGIKKVDMGGLVSSDKARLKYMYKDSMIKELVVPCADYSSASEVGGMFSGCTELTKLDLTHAAGDKIYLSCMFKGISNRDCVTSYIRKGSIVIDTNDNEDDGIAYFNNESGIEKIIEKYKKKMKMLGIERDIVICV